jgi:hypothetical protein
MASGVCVPLSFSSLVKSEGESRPEETFNTTEV